MITSVFKKSTPINYSVLLILVLVVFFVYQFNVGLLSEKTLQVGQKLGLLGLVLGSLFLSNFIVKKNGLTKDSGYTILFFIITTLFFPSVLNNNNLLIANFFVLLAMRRLVSLQTLKFPKEKIFDASLWIFVASLFHFWSILFILVVYLSIIFHVSRDYRNWLLPIVAFFAIAILFVFYALLFDKSAINFYLQQQTIDLKFDYFKNNYQNLALSIYAVFAVFFVFPFLFSLSNKPLNLQASYKKILFSFILGILIFVISPHKSNEFLVFTFFPLSVMATNAIEYTQKKWQQETILITSIVLGLICFFLQL